MQNRFFLKISGILALGALCLGTLVASARASGAKPPRIRHVLLISIDGMHALDLAHFIELKPDSNLARLASKGATYTQTSTAKPSDSYPGLMSIVTGGSPNATGVWYEGSWARNLSPPGSHCSVKGVQVVWDSSVDRNKNLFDGGGIDPAKLPLNPAKGCVPEYPHDYLRVNTIFNVVHAAGMRTAWIDKHPAYEMVNGPSGHGVDDLFTPEISINHSLPAHDVKVGEAYDDTKITALLNEIDGMDHTGKKHVRVPALFGASLQEFTTAQKSCGYADASGHLTPCMVQTFTHMDDGLGKLLAALKAHGLASSTLVIITAKHGDGPIDRRQTRIIPDTLLPSIINQAHPGVLALAYQDGTLASIWLKPKDQSQTAAVVKTLSEPRIESELDIKRILSGESLKMMFNDPLKDPRIPDIVLEPNLGGIYTDADSTFLMEHGGFSDDDTHVALLIAGPGVPSEVIRRPVQTTEIAPTIIKALGLNPEALQAVRMEHTRILPGLPGLP
ncbi:MAG TPA: alkaline phosphatase family protein [Candidatus Dormibacteraeota bacterium]|nr:alkaline phosphatase family protein [Candidatus Dormibacteraeota bacterium]